MPNHLILLGGGRSTRYGKDKLQETFMGRAVLDVLFSSIPWDLFDSVVWVGDKGKVPSKYAETLLFAEGGLTRHASVQNGLSVLEIHPEDKVLIHDSARFLVSTSLFERVLAYLDRCDVVYPAIPPTDALRFHKGNHIETVSREHVYRVQTPQGFKGHVINMVAKAGEVEVYDEVMIAEKLGFGICKVDGDITNVKLTYPEDIRQMEQCINRFVPKVSVGIGFDTHLLGEGSGLYVGGVKVSDKYRSIGWSDGDAFLHATVDAILSANGVSEDIGSLFPPGDIRYKDISSVHMLEEVVSRFGTVDELVGVVVLSKVKLKPFRSDIIEKMKKLIGADKISITFKSAEGMNESLYMAFVVTTVLRRDDT